MLEEKKTFWVELNEQLPSLVDIDTSKFNLIYNIVCNEFSENFEKYIDEIRQIHCGFELHVPKINIVLNINLFTEEVATLIAKIDTLLPYITINLIISDSDIQQESLVALAHSKLNMAVKYNVHINFYFVLFNDYRILRLVFEKMSTLQTAIKTNINNLSSKTYIILEISPIIFENSKDSIHLLIDKIIEELTNDNQLVKNTNDSICGLLNILSQIALNRGIFLKFPMLDTKEANFCFSNHSCFYNILTNSKISCEQCKAKLSKNIPSKLRVFDEISKKILDDTSEENISKILVNDWDYIV